MAELVFILSDFFGTPLNQAGVAMPRLPLLETLLARARQLPLRPDWRSWLALRAAAGAPGSSIAASVAAAWQVSALPAAAAMQFWLATPVHYFAGLDSIQLHPAGLLQLAPPEQLLLTQDFARVFADSGWTLTGLGQRELLLTGAGVDASGADPARFAGADPTPGLPRGQGGASLRRLGSEIEIWLHQHPLNQERQRQAQLPVSTLWFWGAQSAAPPSATAQASPAPLRLYGSDTYAAALWRLLDRELEPLPQRFDEALLTPSDAAFLYPTLQEQGLTQALMRFEQSWLMPAMQALRARQVAAVQLLFDARHYRLQRLDLARFWRSPSPWWEAMS